MQTRRREDRKLKSASTRQLPNKQVLTGAKKQNTATFLFAKHGTLDR